MEEKNLNLNRIFKSKSKSQLSEYESESIMQSYLAPDESLTEAKQNLYYNIFFIILFLIISITNLIYFNAPSHSLNHFIESSIDSQNYKFNSIDSKYKVISRYSENNCIFIELEKINKENSIPGNENIDKLFAYFIFGINRLNIKIFSEQDSKNTNILNELLENKDLNFENKKINNIDESNLEVTIFNYPFDFVIFRKDSEFSETLYDTRNYENKDNTLIYSKNYKSIYFKLPKSHYSYGLGEEFSNFRLEKNKNYIIDKDRNDFEYIFGKKEKKKGFSTMPLMLTINPKSFNPHGLIIFNPEKIEVDLKEEEIIYKIFTGNVNLYILLGKSPKEVIEEFQKTFGMPLLPPFESIEWQDSIRNIPNNELNLFTSIFDKINYITENSKFIESDDTKNKFYPIIKNNYSYDTNILEEIEQKSNNLILFQNFINFTQITLNNTFIINASNIILDSNLNILPLYEIKVYHNKLKRENIYRPMIFSISNFIGGEQYAGKFIANVEFSYSGMKQSLLQTMKNNIYGNPHVVHDACGNNNNSGDLKLNEENIKICIKWIQMISLFPHARINNFNLIRDYLVKNNKTVAINIISESLSLRYSFSLYIYSYYLKMSLEGGSLIRPLILDFASKQFMLEMIDIDTQFMVGSNLMIDMTFDNRDIVNKLIFFPSINFYDFYTGELVNPDGGGKYNITVNSNKLPIYLRAGLITPIQTYFFNLIDPSDFTKIKNNPIKLIFALDRNFRSTGKILLDDMYSNDSINKKIFYNMEISSSYNNDNFIILFHVNSFKYKLKIEEYPFINEIVLYGYTRISIKKITIINKNERTELPKESYYFNNSKNILKINKIKIAMDVDSKIVII